MTARFAALAFWLASFLVAIPAAAQSPDACPRLATVATQPMRDGRFMVPVTLQGHGLSLLVDTGGVITTVKWEQARTLGLPVKQSVRKLNGVGGAMLNFAVEGGTFAIADLGMGSPPLYVEARPLPEADGTLAPDILRKYDVEIDFPRRSLSLIAPDHCAGAERVAAGAAVIAMDVMPNGHVRFPVKVDGKTVIATLDTGSAVTLIGMRAAALLGVYPNAPELALVDQSGRVRVQAYPFQTLDFGGVSLANPRIAIISDSFLPGTTTDLVLGMDALRNLRLTIAYGDSRLYVSEEP